MGVRELFDLTGRVAVVTGGATGLGRQMAEALAELGASVALAARDGGRCEAAARELTAAHGGAAAGFGCDVSDADAVERLAAAVHERFGPADVLVNNAGTAWGAPAESTPLRGWQKVVDVNLTGMFLCSQAFGRRMIGSGGGAIVNMASVTGLRGSAPELLDSIAYTSTKGAVIAFTRDLAVKWARHGIRVNAIAPGWFDTDLSHTVIERSGETLLGTIPLHRLGGDTDLAGAVAYLASPASAYVTGHTLVVDGGVSA
jgi:NAD(P)-dependent dehydrogenase (short-subunit alcohol dehydrogenase family)